MSASPDNPSANELDNLGRAGRQAMAQQDWRTVHECSLAILKRHPQNAEGLFLLGAAMKAANRPRQAIEAFERVLALAPERYDAAVELASQYSMGRRNAEVDALLEKYTAALDNSPKYLDMAGTVYTEIGLPEKAWPLYQRACELQPEITLFQANRAACAVYVGEIDIASEIFRELLADNPAHQRNHYQLARLAKATGREHIEQMESILAASGDPPERNIFLCYALGKEYEDLGDWDKAFACYQQAGDAATGIADYDVEDDIAIIDTVIETCTKEWVASGVEPAPTEKSPLFVVGLPRTGTTLTERILASHSQVESVGETEFVQMILRRESGISSVDKMNPDIIRAAARLPASSLSEGYMQAIAYRLGQAPVFVDKLPFNYLYLGFIARAWPQQKFVLLRRNPMDACFSMYKQVFTWAYKFSYDLDNLARYYVAYDRLCQHWKALLGERLVEVRYEELVSEQEKQTRRLLERLGLPFEPACLSFDEHTAPSTTASSVQVRQKVHTGSIGKWKNFEAQLEPLRKGLVEAGIEIGE